MAAAADRMGWRTISAHRWIGFGALSLLLLTLTVVGVSSGAAASEMDLSVGYDGLVPGSTQDLKFTVYNVGIGSTPATTVSFRVTQPTASATTTQPVPVLAQNQSADFVYHLATPCTPGTIVRATVVLANDAHPNDNTIDANACGPHLRADVVGLAGGSFSDVQIVVTNDGPVSTGPSTVTVQTINQGPINTQTFSIPPLDPGQPFPFLYTLSAQCSGATVQVQPNLPGYPLSLTTSNPLCPVRPTPVPPPDVPDYLQPGVHTLDLEPSAARSAGSFRQQGAGLCGVSAIPPGDLLVGWLQEFCATAAFETGQTVATEVEQAAVRFDLSQVDGIASRLIAHASLTFDEDKIDWSDGAGNDRGPAQHVFGCIAVLGQATNDWVAANSQFPYPNDTIYDVSPGNVTEFDVTHEVDEMIAFPNDPTLRYGFVLRGSIEQLNGDDRSSCMSAINNLELAVTYVVPG